MMVHLGQAVGTISLLVTLMIFLVTLSMLIGRLFQAMKHAEINKMGVWFTYRVILFWYLLHVYIFRNHDQLGQPMVYLVFMIAGAIIMALWGKKVYDKVQKQAALLSE